MNFEKFEQLEVKGSSTSTETLLSFDEQWSKPEKVLLSGGEVELYDVSPETLKTNTPSVMVPGWGGTPEMYRENLRTLVSKGRRAFSVNAPHGVNYHEGEYSPEEIDRVPDAELRKIAALINSLDEKQIEQIDAVGHSEGCMDIVLAASLYPERFRDIVLVNPAGMIGKDNPWRLATSFCVDVVKGYVDEVRKNGITEPMLRSIREVTGSVIQDPVRAFREVLALSDVEIHGLLQGLKEKGIGVSIISAVEDEVFPNERMEKMVTPDMVDGYYTVKGRHNQFQLEADTYTEVVDMALTAMQQKREEREKERYVQSDETKAEILLES